MELNPFDQRLVAAIQGGLPLVARPYEAIAASLGVSESEVIACVQSLQDSGIIRRMGLVVRHHELGYRANGMVVWDIPDDVIDATGKAISGYPFVTLCYQRPRRLPDWPYNLFCMVHGRDRVLVAEAVDAMAAELGLADIPHRILFSRRRFKQTGARYAREACHG